MSTASIEVTGVIPASPEQIYRAWLDAETHSAITGEPADVEPRVGGEFSAYDGYIQGKNLELVPHRRIVQSWRSTEFPEGTPDSRLEVILEPSDEGTRLILRHTDVPEAQADSVREGWTEFYLTPMTAYFEGQPDEDSDTDQGFSEDDEDTDSGSPRGRDDVETVITAPLAVSEEDVTAPPAGRAKSAGKAKPSKSAAKKAPAMKAGPMKAAPAKSAPMKAKAMKAAPSKKPAAKAAAPAKKGAMKAAAAKKPAKMAAAKKPVKAAKKAVAARAKAPAKKSAGMKPQKMMAKASKSMARSAKKPVAKGKAKAAGKKSRR